MKKLFFRRIVCLLFAGILLLSTCPAALAYEKGEACRIDLSAWIQDANRRSYVEMMLDHYVRTDEMVQNALKGGFSAAFLFDGCSDNMNDPVLSDLSYYRVSGVCIVLRLDSSGQPELVYFNDNCTTIPDRPLAIGAWYLAGRGKTGPATILDGTYQMYSVRHKGRYEALNLRTEYFDKLIDAVYLTADGFACSRASEINVHTRTGNHILQTSMWSAGCPLIGSGKAWEFWKLMEKVYYSAFEQFELDLFVGSMTIDRQSLRRELYQLYENPDAVDAILAPSTALQPSAYLASCGIGEECGEGYLLQTRESVHMMTLPCDNATDARSLARGEIPEGEELTALQILTNDRGEQWYKVSWDGKNGFVDGRSVRRITWLEDVFRGR